MTAWRTTILIIITLVVILYTIFKKCRYVSSLPRLCFPLYPFSTILRGTTRTDIFIEVVNLALAEAMWAHFASVAVHRSQLRITGYPPAFDMHIIKKRDIHLRNQEPVANMIFLPIILLAVACQAYTPITERSWVKFREVKDPTYETVPLHEEPDIIHATDI